MNKITIHFDGRTGSVDPPVVITSGSVGMAVDATFSSDWSGLTPILTFRGSGVQYDMSPTASGGVYSTTIPYETLVSAGGHLMIGAYGTNGGGTICVPTVWVDAGVIESGAEPEGASPTPSTPSLVSQILDGGVLPIANGGTGTNSVAGIRASLGTNNASNITTGTLAIAYGGTGANSAEGIRATLGTNNASNITTGTLGIAYGGSGTNTAYGAFRSFVARGDFGSRSLVSETLYEPGMYWVSSADGATDIPGGYSYGWLFVIPSAQANTNYGVQLFVPFNSNGAPGIYVRFFTNNMFYAWTLVGTEATYGVDTLKSDVGNFKCTSTGIAHNSSADINIANNEYGQIVLSAGGGNCKDILIYNAQSGGSVSVTRTTNASDIEVSPSTNKITITNNNSSYLVKVMKMYLPSYVSGG